MTMVTKNTLISELLKANPRIIKELLPKFDLDCLGCKGMATDTLEKAAINHGMDVRKLIKEIKKKI
jgi:hybrid cluster-associated redox disulfide protein